MAQLLDPDVALRQLLEALPAPAVARLAPEECLGLVLAEDAVAAEDLPPFDRAMMDGFAVKVADAGRAVRRLDEIAAGDGRARAPLVEGAAHSIMTGAPVPAGAEAVVQLELCRVEGETVLLPERLRAGANFVPRGAECRAGQVWAPRGCRVTPLTLAAAIGVGAERLAVHPRPTVAVLTTGDELTAAAPGAGQIRDSNGPMLAALLSEAGFLARRATVGDDRGALGARLSELAGASEVIVLSGGVSAGTHDEVPGALRALGAELLFHKVAQKPGKPLLVARRGRTFFFGLPGNPLAAHLCACRYLIPALRRLSGLGSAPLEGRGRLAAELPASSERAWFVPARLNADGTVLPLLPVSSGDLVGPHLAEAYLRAPAGAAALPAGTEVAFTFLGARAWPT